MRIVFLLFLTLVALPILAQADLRKLELQVEPNFEKHSIRVLCKELWKIDRAQANLELLLYPQFTIESIQLNGKQVSNWKRSGTGLSIALPRTDSLVNIQILYSGIPVGAKNPPWGNGFIWSKDLTGKPWLGVVCEHDGAQIWWPVSENYSDKIDQLSVTAIYPENLFFKGNGQLVQDAKTSDGRRSTTWKVTYPMNAYNVTLNIGDFTHIKDSLIRKDGSSLPLNYYPLKYNLDKAIKQLTQVKPMLICYEKAFGNYPFQNDGYSLVETPYVGMEHQGAIGYGNGWIDGYSGSDYSGIDLWFDFILIHETGHEWWGNSVSAKTKADFWLQEAFCTYAEYIYVKSRFGLATANDYINAKKRLIENKLPISQDQSGGIDMYAKGALMIHTLSNFALEKEVWEKIILDFAQAFKYSFITTEELENWFSNRLPGVTPAFFKQYLESAKLPELELQMVSNGENKLLKFRISNGIKGVKIPLFFIGLSECFYATPNWQELKYTGTVPEPDFSKSLFVVKR